MPSQFTINMDTDLPANLPTAPAGAFVFEALLADLDNGQPIHSLNAPLNFYFNTDAPEGLTFDFGYLNEATGSWESMQLLKSDKGGQLCGTTSHLTVFYLAQVPEPASWVLLVGAALALGCARVSGRGRKRRPAC
jgi:hypothetical protein